MASPLAHGLGRMAWHLRVDREAPFPPPPFVIAANHYSHLDPPLVGTVYGRPIVFLAVDELFGVVSAFDALLRLFGAVPLTRSGIPLSAMRAALGQLRSGGVVGLFPEGRRVARWGETPPKRGAAWLAVKADVPLVPVAILGTDAVLGMDNRLRRGRIRVSVGPELVPDGRGPEAVNRLTARWKEWIDGRM